MKGLIVKDLSLMRNQGKSMLLILAIGLFMEASMGAGTIIWFLPFLAAILAVGTLNYDEFDNGYAFLFTLPMTRRQYVREKYLFAVLFVLVCMAISIPLSLILSRFTGKAEFVSFPDILFMTAVSGLISGFLLATVIPLRLKFGSEMSRIVWILIFGGMAAVIAFGTKLSQSPGTPESFRAITGFLEALNSWSAGMILAAFLVITLILLLISEQISERIIVKKEF